jgi:putative flippase GtrA
MWQTSLRIDVFRYLFAGGVVFFLYFSLINLFVDRLSIRYPVGISISYVIAACVHFILNKKYTFGDSGVDIQRQVLRHVVVLFFNYGVAIGVVTLLVERCNQSHYLAALIGIVSTTATGFFASKYWVFAKKKIAFK